MLDTPDDQTVTDTRRKSWMGLLARAPEARLSALCEAMEWPSFDWVRPPEIGGVMVRGRAGGTGAAFNLGEMTITRCALRLQGGALGVAYVQGRSKDHARRAALIDAAMQTAQADQVEAQILAPLRTEESARRTGRAARAAATKVDFFTMARGED